MNEYEVKVPADVPNNMKEEYVKNFNRATHKTGRLMLFAGDQKIEHLNDDFYGTTKEGMQISADDADPEHLFKIASQGTIGVFVAQLGMIARYAKDYPNVAYVVKMNSKTHLIKSEQMDPNSGTLIDFENVLDIKKNGINIVGIGYTVYVGSEYEKEMLKEATQFVIKAHQNGMIAILWMYPRGKAVKDEKDPHLVAGATGVALSIGADFAKVNYPKKEGVSGTARAELFKEAVKSAGRTGVISAGGESRDTRAFLQETYDQINISGAAGSATGRNIHQKSLDEAIRMTKAISAITLGKKDVDFAEKVFRGEEAFTISS